MEFCPARATVMKKSKFAWSASSDEAMLQHVQRQTFGYFLHEANPVNGLMRDSSRKGAPSSVASVGFALSAYPVGVERGFLSRADAVRRTLTTLRFFRTSAQGTGSHATGYKGFYYHFLSMGTDKRVWNCELSTMDTALLLMGILVASVYFDRNTGAEREIRELADALYLRADWQWAQNGDAAVSHGWKPRRGFLKYRWSGYNEALLLYILGLGSPTHPLPERSYAAWAAGFAWKKLYGQQFLYAGPLFIHQFAHAWLDLRGVQDEYMREKKIDCFENSRRATLVQQRYALENPGKFAGYSAHCWGITASEGPGNVTARIGGVRRRFFDYLARGVPFGPDDGTMAPWAAVASLPFAPEIVLPTMRHFDGLNLRGLKRYGFESSFNPTYAVKGQPNGWVGRCHFGLNQGPIVLMIENYRTGFLWELMRRCPYIVTGLRRAGFR